MSGRGGNDTLYGRAGDDLINGFVLNTVTGIPVPAVDNDNRYGAAGRDTLDGGYGDDVLHGGLVVHG